MKIDRTYPNPFYLGLVLIWGLFCFVPGVFIICWIFDINLPFSKRTTSSEELFPDISSLIVPILLSAVFLYFSFKAFYYLVNGWCSASISQKQITAIAPLKAQMKSFEWNDLKGYSTSQDIVKGAHGILWNCDSIVIYTKNNEAFEFIKLFNFRFRIIEKHLKANGVKDFGFEKFRLKDTLFFLEFRRQYKFLGDSEPIEE